MAVAIFAILWVLVVLFGARVWFVDGIATGVGLVHRLQALGETQQEKGIECGNYRRKLNERYVSNLNG